MDAPFAGVFAALPTPYDDRRQVDPKALLHIVDYLLGRELHGFALLTEAAEDPLLTAEERRAIVKLVAQRVGGKKPVIVCVSAATSAEAMDLVRQAELSEASAILLTPLRIPGLGYRELYRHVERVIRGTKLPVMLSARPGNALESLTSEEIGSLFQHAQLKGIFAPQFPPSELEPWAKRIKDKAGASIFAACSFTAAESVRLGATGVICGLSVIGCDKAEESWKLALGKDQMKIDRLEAKLRPAVELLGPPPISDSTDGIQKLARRIARRSLAGPSMAPTFPFGLMKETLKLQGHPVRSDVRSPYESVRAENVEKLKATLQIAGLL